MCCKKPKYEIKFTEKLKKYIDNRDCGGGFENSEIVKYVIVCINCGHLERKGTI